MSEAEAIGDAFAQYGRMKSSIGLVFAVSFAVIFSIFGSFMVIQKKTNTQVQASINKSECSVIYDNKSKQTNTVCNNTVDYTLNNQQLTGSFSSDGEYKTNDKVTLYENNQHLSKDKEIQPLYLGIGTIFSGIIVVLIAYMQYYFAQSSTTYAALSGMSGVRSDMMKIF